jgi:hypothetical protein
MSLNLPLRSFHTASWDGQLATIQFLSTSIRVDHIDENIPSTNTTTITIFHVLSSSETTNDMSTLPKISTFEFVSSGFSEQMILPFMKPEYSDRTE